jgi:hypothetical protein
MIERLSKDSEIEIEAHVSNDGLIIIGQSIDNYLIAITSNDAEKLLKALPEFIRQAKAIKEKDTVVLI